MKASRVLAVGDHVVYMDKQKTFEGIVMERYAVNSYRILLDRPYWRNPRLKEYTIVYPDDVKYLKKG